MVWRAEDPQGGEADKIKYLVVPFTRGKGIDVGCGPKKAFPHFIGVDNCADTELFGIEIKPDVVCQDGSDLNFIEDGDLDFVFSSHLLEHIADTRAALANWWSKIKAGGHLVLYLPHRDLYPNIGQPGSNPDHKHDFTPDDIIDVMVSVCSASDTGIDMLMNETRDQGMEYSFLLVMRKTERSQGGVRSMNLTVPPAPAKTACVSRYGGFGDCIQAANILPELKRQGYHVTFMTTPRGQEILLHDPHIDAWFLQDDNQVPNHELPEFWQANAQRFDKFVNLSESVEGTLLAVPGRANHMWPDSVRRAMLDQNYLEFTSLLAELPYGSDSRFYPSDDERRKAAAYLADFKNALAGPLSIGMRAPDRFQVLWCLAGSSVHKFYPHQDVVIARILDEMPEATVIFNGDYACKLLESGWEDHPRVRCESGEMAIRDSLTLAQQVQCIAGPETGLLNAVAFETMGKVILLSHSSHENLTKHWVNTDALAPAATPCYPCHRLHYGREFCHEDSESGAALCQVDIHPDRVFEAIRGHYRSWQLLRNMGLSK